jgi:hypothetical protein
MASAWVRVVGVVGGGQMGAGIAQLAAAAQLDVILADVDQQALQRGMRNITSSLSKFVKKQALSQVRTRTRRKINSGFHQNSQFTKAHSKISKSCSDDFSVPFLCDTESSLPVGQWILRNLGLKDMRMECTGVIISLSWTNSSISDSSRVS